MKLTEKQLDALIAARDKGGAVYSRGSGMGGARRRMFERLAEQGLLEEWPPFPITVHGLALLASDDVVDFLADRACGLGPRATRLKEIVA